MQKLSIMKKIGVCIVTYNHQEFIAQAIESVLEQRCNATVVIYIGEDHSTDATADICKSLSDKNPDRIKLFKRYQNLGLVANTVDLFKKIQADNCDYIAMLDGDDFWIDQDKLQKQLDFLEDNPEYGLVHTNLKLLYSDGTINKNSRKNVISGFVFDINPIPAIGNCTVCFRTELLDKCNFDDFISWQFMSVDYVMYIILAKYTKFQFLADSTAMWRRGHPSVSNTGSMQNQINYLENGIRMWHYLNYLFPERFPYNEFAVEGFRNYSTLQIAFKFKNYQKAHDVARLNLGRKGLKIKIKKLITKNRLLFDLYCKIFRK